MKQLTSLIFRWNWIRFTDWLPRQKSLNFWTKIMKIGHSGVSHSFGHKCPSAGIKEDLYLDNAATPQLFGNIWWVLKSSISCPSYSLILSLVQEVLREESQIEPQFLLDTDLFGSQEHTKNYFHLPYARHYNPRFVYFLPTFWRSLMYCDLWPYVWLVFKSGF